MRYLELLRHRDFALLWLGATASILGDGLSWVTLVWLVYELGGGSADVGLLVVCYTAPVIVGGLAAGLVLDRFDKRRVLIADNTIRGLAVASVPVAAGLGILGSGWLFVVAAVYGLLYMVSLAGIPSMLPSLVPSDRLETANAMETISYSLGGLAGPAIAGILIGFVGARWVLLVDAASYAVFVGCLVAMRWRGRDPRDADEDGSPDAAARGLRPAFVFIVTTPAILAITLMFMGANIGEGALLVLLPTIAREVLAGDAATYGALVSAMTAGMLLGSTVVGAIRWRWPLGRSVAIAQASAGIVLAGLALRPALAGTLVMLAVFGLLVSPLTIWAQTIRMRLIPPAMRGRVFASLRTLMQSTPPIGGALAGIALTGSPVELVALAAAACIAVPGLVGLIHPALRGDVGDVVRADPTILASS